MPFIDLVKPQLNTHVIFFNTLILVYYDIIKLVSDLKNTNTNH
jgi:hypothetical protein